jgi:hypothetical protein
VWGTIRRGDCDVLIDGVLYVRDRTEKVRMLLEAGADVRVRGRECDCVLDREGVSVLERGRRRVDEYSKSWYYRDTVTKYKKVRNKIMKHIRRYSI